jgi:hypothetical protein
MLYAFGFIGLFTIGGLARSLAAGACRVFSETGQHPGAKQ